MEMKDIFTTKMWRSMVLVAVCTGWLTACTVEDNAVVPEPTEPEREYSERMVTVVDPKNTPQGMVTLRFYNDMPSVAYVSVSAFQNLMYPGTTVQVNQTGRDQYELTNAFGTATVNVTSDTFESDDYEAFTNLMGQVQEGMANTVYDALPIVRWKSIETTPRQVHLKLDYGKAGQMTRDLLQSQSMYDFIAGTATLGRLLDDGGHTYTNVTAINPMSGNASFAEKLIPYGKEKVEEFSSYCPEYEQVNEEKQSRVNERKTLAALRTEKFGNGVHYVKVGNTAYCQFDKFLCDDSGWRKFYKGEGAKPTLKDYPNDWLIILQDALDRAQKDPEVKNFILDISTNGGGSSDIVMLITSLLCNKADIYYENALTGQKVKCSYEVDRNLDGQFDEKDKAVKYDLNFGLVISSFSFSCGNMLPGLLKDYGIPLFGKQSGGGSCCVLFSPSADGFGYRYSTHRSRMTDTKFVNIDSGITPHYELAIEEFFDIEKIGKLIEKHYSK